MVKYIYLILLFCLQSITAQKKYVFNLYEASKSKMGDTSLYEIKLSDSLSSSYYLTFFARNNEIINVTLLDIEVGELYKFQVYEKSFENFKIGDNLKNYEIFKLLKGREKNDKYCKKHYTRQQTMLNDSVSEETFTFYKKKKKKKITSIIKVQSHNFKNRTNKFTSETVEMISSCIDKSYASKFIMNIDAKYYKGKYLSFEFNKNLADVQPINFTFILQK